MGKYEDLLKELAEKYDIEDEDLEQLKDRSFAAAEIREFNKVKQERDDLRNEVDSYKKAPVREKFFKEVARVNFDELRPAELDAINSFSWEGDEPDPAALTAFVEKNKFPVLPGEPSEAVDQPAAARIANESLQNRPLVIPAKTTRAEQIAEHEQAAAEARAEGKDQIATQHMEAAMSLKNQSLKPEGLAAAPA